MQPVPHSRLINSNIEADVLETEAKLGKMLMIFVISISKLTKTARFDGEVRPGRHILGVYLLEICKFVSCVNLNSNSVLPVPIGSSRNSNFEADVSRHIVPEHFCRLFS